MKIQLISHSPLLHSGYAGQAGLWARQWSKAGHQVWIQATHGSRGAAASWEDVTILPSTSNVNAYGMDLAGHYAEKIRPDVIITLIDAWTMDAPSLKELRQFCPVALWMPVDAMPLSKADRRVLNGSGAVPVAMSRFGELMLKDAGYNPLYAPHALDMNAWQRHSPEQRKAARDALGVSETTFVIGMNAANGDVLDRKNWFIQLAAYRQFLNSHPDSLFLAHTTPRSTAIDLEYMAFSFLGIPEDKLIFPDQLDVVTGVYTEGVLYREFYAAADVGTSTSAGEGFGLAALEFQACGVPIVTTAASAQAEVGAPGEFGALFVPGNICYVNLHGAAWARPPILSVQQAYERAWSEWSSPDKNLWRSRQETARKHALTYDKDEVLDKYWVPVLADLAGRKEGS